MEPSADIDRLDRMVDDLRACGAGFASRRTTATRRYHAFSASISFLLKVTDDLRAEGTQ